jgi:uncharacterized protein (TIGR03437 family)
VLNTAGIVVLANPIAVALDSGGTSTSPMAPGYVGLYQINAQVPTGHAAENQPVVITISGTTSKSVPLPVQ